MLNLFYGILGRSLKIIDFGHIFTTFICKPGNPPPPNCKEMLAITDLEPDMREMCENLVFNKTPDATDEMLPKAPMKVGNLQNKPAFGSLYI